MTATLQPTETSGTFDSLDPANGDLVGTHPVSTRADVDAELATA